MALNDVARQFGRMAGRESLRHAKPGSDPVDLFGLDHVDWETRLLEVGHPSGTAAAVRVAMDRDLGQAFDGRRRLGEGRSGDPEHYGASGQSVSLRHGGLLCTERMMRALMRRGRPSCPAPTAHAAVPTSRLSAGVGEMLTRPVGAGPDRP